MTKGIGKYVPFSRTRLQRIQQFTPAYEIKQLIIPLLQTPLDETEKAIDKCQILTQIDFYRVSQIDANHLIW